MKNIITIKETISIQADKEDVWDFTQDFSNRLGWDKSIKALKILQLKPFKIIELRTFGGVITKLQYKLCQKPNKTSLKMTDTKSFLIQGGGGSWNYKTVAGLTEWTQVNTLVLKNSIYYHSLGWLIKKTLKWSTKKNMIRAKILIEKTTHNNI